MFAKQNRPNIHGTTRDEKTPQRRDEQTPQHSPATALATGLVWQ
jgi:hypothetical protein